MVHAVCATPTRRLPGPQRPPTDWKIAAKCRFIILHANVTDVTDVTDGVPCTGRSGCGQTVINGHGGVYWNEGGASLEPWWSFFGRVAMFGQSSNGWCENMFTPRLWRKPRDFRPLIMFIKHISDFPVRWIRYCGDFYLHRTIPYYCSTSTETRFRSFRTETIW